MFTKEHKNIREVKLSFNDTIVISSARILPGKCLSKNSF